MVVMKKREIAVAEPRSLAKGLIAGCLGGVAGILAMTFAERLFPPQARAEAAGRTGWRISRRKRTR